MKQKLIYLSVVSATIFLFSLSSCNEDDVTNIEIIDNDNSGTGQKTDTLGPWFSKQIAGNWIYYTGDTLCTFIVESKRELYSQEMSFVSNGNISEKIFTSYQYDSQNGNWKIEKNKLLLNDWNGNNIKDTITILDISESEMILSYLNKELIYKRTEWLYDSINFCNEILGYWKTMERDFPRHTYSFSSNGTVGHHDYVWERVGGYGVYPWKYNPKTRELTTSQPTTGAKIVTSKVEFINKKYLRWYLIFTRNLFFIELNICINAIYFVLLHRLI